jgi:S-formylglutathione hydrolase FrmB
LRILGIAFCLLAAQAFAKSPLRFEISWDKPMDGHVVLVVSTTSAPEPRFQINEGLTTQQMFGAAVDGAGSVTIDGATVGYPREYLDQVPPGEYYVQAVLSVYETFHRADGHTVKLPMDHGEGQHWNRKPGNLYSEPVKMRIDPASATTIRIDLAKIIPPIEPPRDTRYIKHVKIESKLLSAFWGRPMYVGAVVLLPEGYDEHPAARYPVLYYQSHFAPTFRAGVGFREEKPTGGAGGAQNDYRFYQDWTSGRLPRMLIVDTQDANPYYDDSYAVNSANVGPYGDALVEELYPYIEKQFRGIGEPWARALYGGSTGGWRVLALQVFHPDFFNGAWPACPDPIDFRAYGMVNLYEDKNAFYANSTWKQVPVPMQRAADGKVTSVMEDAIRFELVLGTKSRSGEQYDIWQAAYSPAGEDGYPQFIIDPRTGIIDHRVADYWKEHYDLDYIMQRDWKTLGPKLAGKLHFAVGDADSFYLDRAVRLTEKFLESTRQIGKGPYFGGDFDYGPGMPHCYTGNPHVPMSVSGPTINQRLMPLMMEHMLETAPPGADTKSWRY